MKTNFLSILILILIISCTPEETDVRETKTHSMSKKSLTENRKEHETLNDSIRIDEDSVCIPEFEIEVQLSPKAESKIEESKESIIVMAYFSGIPKDTLIEEYEEWGKVVIGSERRELWGSKIAAFKNVKISKTAYEDLYNKNFEVLINVFTGRHSSESNLLSCEILQKGINEIKGRKHSVKGELIYGE